MKTKSPLHTYLSEEERKEAIQEIINYFATERDEEIGLIAAEDMLNMFLETSGKAIYNQAISDTQDFIKQRFEELDTNIELQLKRD